MWFTMVGSRATALALLVGLAAGCSIRKLAVNSLADALASGGDVFATDEDPQLVREAVPFALKTYESLLVENPEHRDLLVATARGFTQYAYAFVQRDAELIEDVDIVAAVRIRERARRLMLRGRDYGLQALELDHAGLGAELRRGRLDRIAAIGADQIDALFWTGAAWGVAIAVLKNDAGLIADLPVVSAMLRRVIELDESFGLGAAHEVMVTLEASLAGGSLDEAKAHFERAVELTGGNSAATFVSYAETVAVNKQDRQQFEELLARALAIDLDAEPSLRLSNVLAQERARWLEGRIEDLFGE